MSLIYYEWSSPLGAAVHRAEERPEGRNTAQLILIEGADYISSCLLGIAMSASHIFRIPNDLLIKIFGFLPEYGFLWADEDIPLSACLPYPLSDEDRNSDPKQGARVMPYLPQVSKHWRDLSKLRDTKVGHHTVNSIVSHACIPVRVHFPCHTFPYFHRLS